jgi:hypothetical protein
MNVNTGYRKKHCNPMIRPVQISHSVKLSIAKGIAVGVITVFVYLLIVVVTTPSLPPPNAILVAVTINPIIIIGTSAGTGTQIFISSYGKNLGCRLNNKKKGILGAGSGSTAFSSFLSFFFLVPLGCCGSWLFILSFLPSIFGTTLSVALIQYSAPLSYAGLAFLFGFTSLSAFKLQRELKLRKITNAQHTPESSSSGQ